MLVNVAAAAHCSSRRSHAKLQLFQISNLLHHLQLWSCMTLAAACMPAALRGRLSCMAWRQAGRMSDCCAQW